jgi:hypothetical protein
MPHIAVQNIASGFGTFHVGDELDEGVPEPVRDAWLAAGLVEEAAAEPPKPAPVEKATKGPKETTASRRMQTQPTPHKRFVEKAE